MHRSIILRTQIIVELSLSSLYFCGENIVPLSTRVCVRAPGLKNNAGIYCLAINVSITCKNYSSAVSVISFSHVVLLLLVHHTLLLVIQLVLQHCVLGRWAVTHQAVALLVLWDELQSPFLFFSNFQHFCIGFQLHSDALGSI